MDRESRISIYGSIIFVLVTCGLILLLELCYIGYLYSTNTFDLALFTFSNPITIVILFISYLIGYLVSHNWKKNQ